jgi:hypothetical protein
MDVSDITISLPSQKAFRPPSKIYPGRVAMPRAVEIPARAANDRRAKTEKPGLRRHCSAKLEPSDSFIKNHGWRTFGPATSSPARKTPIDIRGPVAMERSKFLVKRKYQAI